LKSTTPIPKFAPGFRLSLRDAIVLVVGIGSSIALGKIFWPASLIIAVASGHFFLFCNVFRISRRLELIWAGIFIVLSGATILAEFPEWAVTIAISICATVAVVICETRKPSYHGVGWRRINPHLKSWWDSNLAGKI
jgi:hypothetical protein